MLKSRFWVVWFLVLYGLHAVFYLTYTGRLPLPVSAGFAQDASMLSLLGLTVLVVVFIATRDEVVRRLALQAGAASALVTAVLTYFISAFDVELPMLAASIWAVAILVFLLVYGWLTWRARW